MPGLPGVTNRASTPADRQGQLVEIVRRRGAATGDESLSRVDVSEQTIVGVVDQLAFLMLLDGLDGQAQLILEIWSCGLP